MENIMHGEVLWQGIICMHNRQESLGTPSQAQEVTFLLDTYMSVAPYFCSHLVNHSDWWCESLMRVPTDFMPGYAQQLQCHCSRFFSWCQPIAQLCSRYVPQLRCSVLQQGFTWTSWLLLVDNEHTNTCAYLGSNPWFSINVSFFFFFLQRPNTRH